MATNGVAAQQGLKKVLAAVETMQGNVDRTSKEEAVQFLDKFQKTVRVYGENGTVMANRIQVRLLEHVFHHLANGGYE